MFQPGHHPQRVYTHAARAIRQYKGFEVWDRIASWRHPAVRSALSSRPPRQQEVWPRRTSDILLLEVINGKLQFPSLFLREPGECPSRHGAARRVGTTIARSNAWNSSERMSVPMSQCYVTQKVNIAKLKFSFFISREILLYLILIIFISFR